jgi:hypothetical protein
LDCIKLLKPVEKAAVELLPLMEKRLQGEINLVSRIVSSM